MDAIGIDAGKIIVLPNGADPDVLRAVDERRRGPSPLRLRRTGSSIGFVGILRPWHGVDLLLEAFRELATQLCSMRTC